MPARTVRIWPDPVLTTPAKPVTIFDAALATLVEDMFVTMGEENGIGLAANQIGELQRVFVVDLDRGNERASDPELDGELREDNFTGPLALVNPVIVARSGKLRWEEACLSVPDVSAVLERSAEVTVEAQTVTGAPLRVTARGLFAVCLQHELDHLDGKVFVDYLSQLKRDVIRRKMVRHYGSDTPRGNARRKAG